MRCPLPSTGPIQWPILVVLATLIASACDDAPEDPEVSKYPVVAITVPPVESVDSVASLPEDAGAASSPREESDHSVDQEQPASKNRTGGSDGIPSAPATHPDDPVSFSPLPSVEGLIVLSKEQQVWIDKDKKRIVVDGEICLTQGQLELLLSQEGMKTHEAVIKTKARPSTVHAGLLAVGAQQGSPVSYRPEYQAATGSVVEILVLWWDEEGKRHEAHAQEFVRSLDKPLRRGDELLEPLMAVANKSPGDVLVLDGVPRARWEPVPPYFAKRIRKDTGLVTRPSRAGKQVEQLMVRIPREGPKEKTRRARDVLVAARRSNPKHQALIELARKSPDDVQELDGVERIHWKPVSPQRANDIRSDPDLVLRPSPAGKQMEVLLKIGGALAHEWVFGGSEIGEDGATGEEYYLADRTGDFVCVSNFPTAMLDLPIESSADNSGLGFEAFTKNIPPKGTKVRMIMTPQPLEKKGAVLKKTEPSTPGEADSKEKKAPVLNTTER